jgi:hypothetical protein
MNADDRAELRQELLLHESKQLHDNIQRNLSDMQKLLGLAFPVLTGAFALAVEGKIGTDPDRGLLYALFSILASLLVVLFNNVWMQLLTFTRYKYAEVLPKLYVLTERGGDNYGQYTVRGGLLRTMLGAVIVQALLLPTAAAATYYVQRHFPMEPFAIPASLSVGFAALTTVVSWFIARDTVNTVRASIVQPSRDGQ